jgi:hypothetical protein
MRGGGYELHRHRSLVVLSLVRSLPLMPARSVPAVEQHKAAPQALKSVLTQGGGVA